MKVVIKIDYSRADVVKNMKKHIFANLYNSWAISVSAIFYITLLLFMAPVGAHAQLTAIDNGAAWLLTNQNPSGSWGNADETELRDTTASADILKKLLRTDTGYESAISFIEGASTANQDFLARKVAVLAQKGTDVSALIIELLAGQNPNETDNTLTNFPEGGWGAAAGYASNCLDTSLVLNALSHTPVPKGLLVIDKSIAAGETQDFYFDFPTDASNLQIFISDLSGNIDFRIFPNDSGAYNYWSGLTTSTYLGTGGLTIDPGIRKIQIYGNSASTFSFQVSLASGGYDSSVLVNPIAYLFAAQNGDGGWGLGKGSDSNIYMTAMVLIALEGYSDNYDLGAAIDSGITWLKTQQNDDDGFGSDGSSIYETALAYTAMANMDASSLEAQNALAYILVKQNVNGSWNDTAYDTAVSLLALYTSMLTIDTDGDGVPDLTDNCPDDQNFDQKNTDKENEGLPGYPIGDVQGDACDDDDDNDGLTDAYEINFTATNPLTPDSDGDLIPDDLEDMDFDGTNNADELIRGTNPQNPDILLSTGLNLFGYPVGVPAGYTSYDMIADLGTENEIEKIQRYNSTTGEFETTFYESGVAGGTEFDIVSGEGYYVYAKQAKSISFAGSIFSPMINLVQGVNLVSIPAMPANFNSYDFLSYLGFTEDIANIQRFNSETGAFDTTVYWNNRPSGVKFPIINGEAYLIHMKADKIVAAVLTTPVVSITSPVNETTVSSPSIDVSGTITDCFSTVRINGIEATVDAGTFFAIEIPLSGGTNIITATATSPNNLTASHSINVILDAGIDYEITKGGSVSDSRDFQADSVLLDQSTYYTESQTEVPTGVTYTTTNVVRTSATNMQISFVIQVSSLATDSIQEFQVEYGLLDGANNPLEPLVNNVFSFKIQVVP